MATVWFVSHLKKKVDLSIENNDLENRKCSFFIAALSLSVISVGFAIDQSNVSGLEGLGAGLIGLAVYLCSFFLVIPFVWIGYAKGERPRYLGIIALLIYITPMVIPS
ncbi:hypothetical protein BCF53_103383 [Reinekea marinisedimentorum]|uniref:Uncharacterized protein n=1 Tax=Reinekea marinisedimentorum TaxID=230495 RepID=A0A4R3I8V8_9GAMM|nr:hypothetical protein BCF53_103383 [Reinekea marinisedimentorum]